MKRITDPDFRYVPARETDIRKTFKRVRQELARRQQPARRPEEKR